MAGREDANPKKLSDHMPPLKEQGMDYLAAAARAGVGIQAKLITQSGVAPLVVDLEAEGMSPMADTNDVVISQVEGKACTVDESTKTKTGFNVLLGGDTEVHNLLVIGTLAGQAGKDS